MLHKKYYRILSLILCTALFSNAVPHTVNAAQLYDKNDTYVINEESSEPEAEQETERFSNMESSHAETENFSEKETESEVRTEAETEIHTSEAPETSSEAETSFETETSSETETSFETETSSETVTEPETETDSASSDFEEESETDTSLEFETESEAESETELTTDAAKLQNAVEEFNTLADTKPLMALLYRTNSYNVRQSPSYDSDTVAVIESGHTLYVKSVEIIDGKIWYQVKFGLNGTEYTGYAEAYYLAYSDEDWISWVSTLNDTSVINSFASNGKADTSDIDAFPVFYRDKLRALKALHPNWTFVPMNTGIDFNTAVTNEMGDKSLIQNTNSNAEKGWVGKTYGSGWYYATKDAVMHYMDPCNFLTENYIFQFEQLTFNSSYHTVSAIQNFLNGTFMKGKLPDDAGKTYAQAFFEIGKSRSLSPIHLASRVYQEQGSGKSALISGTYNNYKGYYNYFNVKASGKTEQEIIENGLSYAKSQGWNTHYKSLAGGAATIGNNYILKGQDTLYLEKFNVDGSYYPLYTHQYMQNIQAPASEAITTKKMYANAGSLDSAFVFKIPVFLNMPEEQHLESISLDKSTLILQTPDSLTGAPTDLDTHDALTVRYNPANTSDEITVKWKSSNLNVAGITASDSDGKIFVTAEGEGTATITATATAKDPDTGNTTVKTADCQVRVLAPAPEIETCTVTFMDKDNTTVLKTIETPYEGSIAETDFPIISVSDDELFIGWFTEKGGKGTLFDSTTVLSANELVVYPYCEVQGKGFYVLPISDHVYTGSAIKPEVQVFDSVLNTDGTHRLITLEKGKDYTVAYKNNKNANTKDSASPAVVIKGKGNYTGTEYAYFNIIPKPLTDKDISVENMTVAYNGKVQKPTPAIYRAGKKLSVKKDFTLSYPETGKNAYTDAGTYPVIITGAGGYSGTLTIYQKITSDILMSKVKVEKIPNQTYDEALANSGQGMTPNKLNVSYGDRILEEGRDYSVRYANHLSVGTATAYITAKNGTGFSGTKSVTYKIVGLPVNKAVVSGIEPKSYTGMERDVLQEDAILTYDGKALQENKDYTVSYSNTTKAGTASILFKGINGYSGQLKKTYKITPLDITDNAITMTYTTQDAADTPISITSLSQITSPYMKGSTCPDIQLYLYGTPLTKGKDYTVKYANNKQVTTSDLEEKKLPAITVTGKGNFKGSLKGTWVITDSAFGGSSDKVKLVLKDMVYKNKPGKFKTAVTLIDANGAKLSAGKDYDKSVLFSYDTDTVIKTADGSKVSRKAGDTVNDNDIPDADTVIRVTVKGLGAYKGDDSAAIIGTYRIISSDIAKAKVSVKAKAYQNGDAVTLTADDIQITLNGDTLKYGTDYTIDTATYANNLKKGKASVILKGLGKNYGGEKKISYTINSKVLVWWKNLVY